MHTHSHKRNMTIDKTPHFKLTVSLPDTLKLTPTACWAPEVTFKWWHCHFCSSQHSSSCLFIHNPRAAKELGFFFGGGVTGDQPQDSAPSAGRTWDRTLALSGWSWWEGLGASRSSLRRISKTAQKKKKKSSSLHLFSLSFSYLPIKPLMLFLFPSPNPCLSSYRKHCFTLHHATINWIKAKSPRSSFVVKSVVFRADVTVKCFHRVQP